MTIFTELEKNSKICTEPQITPNSQSHLKKGDKQTNNKTQIIKIKQEAWDFLTLKHTTEL
jgi:hypothetical protein